MNSAGPIPARLSEDSQSGTGGLSRAVVHEGLVVELTPAPPLKRFLAFCVDWGILGVISYGLFVGTTLLLLGLFALLGGVLQTGVQRPFSQGVAVVIGVALLITVLVLAYLSFIHGYFIYYHLKRGYTPGKGLFGLKVISLDGKPLTRGQCILREFLVYVDAGFIFPGLVSILATERRQRLGDLAAGTMVTHSRRIEEREDYLYITQEQYDLLKDALVCRPVSTAVAEDYLRFAYRYFVTKESVPSESDLSRWETRISQYIPDAGRHGMDRQSVLLYFAEYCFQSTRS